MENLSTSDYAEMIAESETNGQFKQAKAQFLDALTENVNAFSLLMEITAIIGEEKALKLAAAIIDKRD